MSHDGFDQRFRPLTASALGAGAMVIGVLGFAGEVWGSVPAASREAIAAAARTAYIAFGMVAASLLIAYALQGLIGGLGRAWLNLSGASTFLTGLFVCGGLISDALFVTQPETRPVPEAVQGLSRNWRGSADRACRRPGTCGADRRYSRRPSPAARPRGELICR